MRHVTLTCKNHPELRWSCKSIAFSPGYGYNGTRSIFYDGTVQNKDKALADIGKWATEGKPGDVLKLDTVHVPECPCSPKDLVLAPEELELQQTDPTYTPDGHDID